MKIVEKSEKVYALLDHDKFGKSALVTYAQLSKMDVIICDQLLPMEFQKFAEKNKIKILLSENVNR